MSFRYEQCGCLHPWQWINPIVFDRQSNTTIRGSLCNITDPCYTYEADRVMKTPSLYRGYCPSCLTECSVVTLNVVATFISAPPSWLLPSVKDFVEKSAIPLPSDWNTSWSTRIPLDYVAIDLVREKNYVENYTDEASISGLNLLSNIGGHTGLWIGMSFLSLLEVIEMVYRLIRAQCLRCLR